MKYWITLEVEATDEMDACDYAAGIADSAAALIVQVQSAPPQGSTIVGSYEH